MEIVIKLLELEKAKVQTEIAEWNFRESKWVGPKSPDEEKYKEGLIKLNNELFEAISLLERKTV